MLRHQSVISEYHGRKSEKHLLYTLSSLRAGLKILNTKLVRQLSRLLDAHLALLYHITLRSHQNKHSSIKGIRQLRGIRKTLQLISIKSNSTK
jgi:hypothetical protein